MIKTQPLSNDEAFDTWCRDLVTQAVEHRNAAWTLGDLLIEGLEKFDEARVWTAAEATGMTPETLTNYKSLAKAFRPGRRRMNLGITVHETVRALDETAQNLFLDMVEKYEISREALRERVRAYKAGDAGAANYKWKPLPKVVEVEDSHAGVRNDDDKPVMDGTDFGQGMAAEKVERERGEDTLSDANQILMRGMDTVERALGAENRRMLPLAKVNTARLRALASELSRLADEADVVQSGRMKPRQNAGPFSQEAKAKGEGDGKSAPRTPDLDESQADSRATTGGSRPCTSSAGTEGDADRRPISNPAPSAPDKDGVVSPHPSPATPSEPFTTQIVDGIAIEQPDDIPANFRRSHG